jgi:hypothetical protein
MIGHTPETADVTGVGWAADHFSHRNHPRSTSIHNIWGCWIRGLYQNFKAAVSNQRMVKKTNGRAAFLVIKSAEGQRSSLLRGISPEQIRIQRNNLAKAGIKKIRPSLPRWYDNPKETV